MERSGVRNSTIVVMEVIVRCMYVLFEECCKASTFYAYNTYFFLKSSFFLRKKVALMFNRYNNFNRMS